METEEFRVSVVIRTSPNRVYEAWLDERQHTAFTGARASVAPWVGGRHTCLDGFAAGTLVRFDTGRSILMTWRASDFPAQAPDSTVEVLFEPIAGGVKLTVVHSGIPAGLGGKYKELWRDHYLDPLKKVLTKPGAMQDALRAAARAGRMPIPGVTSAPATARHVGVPAPALIPKGPPAEAVEDSGDGDDGDDDETDSERPAPRRERGEKRNEKRAAKSVPPPKSAPPPKARVGAVKEAKAAPKAVSKPPPKQAPTSSKAKTAPAKAKTAPPPRKKPATKKR